MKPNLSLTLADHRLMELVWQTQPVPSAQLCKLAEASLGWKRTTTYTVIKRLGERGVLKLENGIVSSLISREEAEKAEIETFVETKFGGSLPAFVAAFTKHQKLSDADLDEVQRMIDRIRRGGGAP
jgi:predicted transcriptional regulator